MSGAFGEDVAIERLKAGAVDYVLKHRLSRLPSSVRRGLREARARADRDRAERALRRLNSELDAQVASRTAELARTNEQLAARERELRESEARLAAILEHSPVAICVKDLEGRYLMANPHFLTVVGRDRASVLGRTAWDFLPAPLAAAYTANDRQVVERGHAMEFEEPASVGGRVRVFASSKFLLRRADGEPYALCGISVDVTERRHAEEDARIAAREAQRVNAAKNEFLSRMSHDLRTPLNAILGFAQVLETERLTADQAESVRQILAGGRHLLGLINEVLDITRIESGRLSLSPEPVPVAEIIDRAVNLIRHLAERQGIRLVSPETDPALHVHADRQRLTEILLNLLSNAVKYNRRQGSVTIGVAPHGTGRLRIRVTDTGAGLTPAQVRLLFRPFERLGAERTGIEGTGLGLALSRGLAEAMGGSVGLETTPGAGSTFWVELSLKTAATDGPKRGASAQAPGPPPSSAGGTVVYVEDNPSNVRLIQRVLQARPAVTLLVAATGEHGLALVRERRPSLVLLDLHLPDMSGEDVAVRLASDPATRGVPVVVLSADATPRQIQRLTALGAAGYLTKPLNIGGVLDAIDRHLRAADAQP